MKDWYAENTNPEGVQGDLTEAIKGADLFLGLSGPDTFKLEQLKTMAKDPIVFAMANPVPEIMPEVAAGHVSVMATGRSRLPEPDQQRARVPGHLPRARSTCGRRSISEGMKVAAAEAIAGVIPDDELNPDYIIPSVFNRAVAPAVAAEVRRVAVDEGLARVSPPVGG